MKLINLLMGLFFVLVDAIKALFNILIGALSTFLLNSKKDNEFKRLLGTENYFVDTIILLGLFFGIGYFSIFMAALFLAPSIFIVYEYKKKWYNNQNRSIPDDSFAFSGITAVVMGLLIITLVNTQTPYSYKVVAEVELSAEDVYYKTKQKDGNTTKDALISRGEIDFEYNNAIRDLDVRNCKPGTYKVLEETLHPMWFNVIKTDYYAECSRFVDIKKQVKVIKD